MRKLIFLQLSVWCFFIAHSQNNSHADPLKVRLITTDVTNFWSMFNQLKTAKSRQDSLSLIEAAYISKASVGLQQLMQKKNYSFTVNDVLNTINRYTDYLKSIERSSQQIDQHKPSVIQSFQKLKKIYPEARFPDFYFAIGVFGSGGTGIPAGMFIGVEIEAADDKSPLESLPAYLQSGVKTVDKISLICAHELIHFQQRDNPINLLGAAIHEGACDFIGELISGRLINQYQHQYGSAREVAIWKKFKEQMNGNDYSNWLYNGGTVKDYPADMGYFVGYNICKAYYKNEKNKQKALVDILTISDYNKFLQKSNYDQIIKSMEYPIQDVSYQIKLTITPEQKKLRNKSSIHFFAAAQLPDTLKLLLHKEAQITSIKLNGKKCSFLLRQSDKASNSYMPESRDLLVFSMEKKKGKQLLQIDYEIVFTELKQNNSAFTNNWISLASYSSWYPVNYDWGSFSFDIAVHLPAGYKLSGTGTISREGSTWNLAQKEKTSDIVLVISDQLQTRTFTNQQVAIRFDYIAYAEEQADSILNGTSDAFQFFSSMFGSIRSGQLTVVATPQKGGSAYSRKDFFYMQTKGQSSMETLKTISHEVAHFWWNTGDGETWEDWLSESFAEFSTLLFLKNQLGDSLYTSILNNYKNSTEGLAPIWGLKRSDNNASLILYYKGSVILSRFMAQVGEKKFLQLMRQMHQSKISKTQMLLSLIEQQISKDDAHILEMLLKE